MMKTFMIRIAAMAMLVAPLPACNTMEGLGQDIKSAGSSLENAARRN